VPGRRAGGRPLALHSTVDPLKEGNRYLDLYGRAGYLVFLGLGGGYQVLPFLPASGASRLLIVEADVPFLRAVLETMDLGPILNDSRVRLQLGEDPLALQAFLLADYLPAVHGELRTVPLQSAIAQRPRGYAELAEAIRQAMDRAADDFTVQTRLGRRWFLNTLANLPAAQEATVRIPPSTRALVTGAGPSLERQMRHIPRLRADACLIACDTSLPCLLQHGVVPDLVISIDCQQWSYHHFLGGAPPQAPLVLDLASPPLLARLGLPTAFFASGHPLSRLLAERWRPLPSLDVSGGNVAHAAVSLALRLGADEIHLLGADFSYPHGKAYCRGAYVYPLFLGAQDRLRPLEAQQLSLVFRSERLVREAMPGGLRYTPPQLLAYRRRLQQMAREAGARIVAWPADGPPAGRPPARRPHAAHSGAAHSGAAHPARDSDGQPLGPGPARCPWQEFLAGYLHDLESLPAPTAPAGPYLEALSAGERALWATLLPTAAFLRQDRASGAAEGHRLLAQTRDWAIRAARRFLARDQALCG